MFILDGKPLSPDRPFSHDGVNYPANWLRLSTLEQKEAIGISEVPDPPTWDQRFYWGYDQDGKLIPKDHGELCRQWIAQTRQTANTLLSPSDWQIVREIDNGTLIDPVLKTWREAIRHAANEKVLYIGTTNDTPDLAAYITGPSYPVWPSLDPTPVDDTIVIPDDLIGSGEAV
jgi:hypothetical protein